MMSVAQKLSWEIVAQNDLGGVSDPQRLALEIAYGVALEVDEPVLFKAIMASVISQVTDAQTQRLLRLYTVRGLK